MDARHPSPGQPARHYVVKSGQIRGDVQGESVKRNPSADADANSADLREIPACRYPYTDRFRVGAALDAQLGQRGDHNRLQPMDISADRQPMPRQTNDGIGHYLSRAVVSDIAAPIAVDQFDSLFRQFFRTGDEISDGFRARPSVTTGKCSTMKIVSGPPDRTCSCAALLQFPRLAVRHAAEIIHRDPCGHRRERLECGHGNVIFRSRFRDQKNHAGNATITLIGRDGKPAAKQEVTVAQARHKFLFGCTGSSLIALANDELNGEAKSQAESHAGSLTRLFNFVTLPFYWGRFEPKRGQPDTARITRAAKWFIDHGCVLKGHPLCWHTVSANWLMEMSDEQIVETQLARIRREVTDFSGLIDIWDVINEVVIMPIFDKYDNGISRMARRLGRIGIIRATLDAARSANPRAMLLLNDFDVSAAYECLIEGCLEAGIKIDALGIQSHMHQGYWGVEKTRRVLERFARYKLPIHFTENTLVSGKIMPPEIVDLNDYQVEEWPTTPEGEARQAEEVVMHYKTLMAHPQVKAITWWGLQDGGWLKAPSGLLRIDRSRKPAFDALLNLVKGEWWLPPTKMMTDKNGQMRVEGFAGEYSIICAGQNASFELCPTRDSKIEVRM